MEGALIYDRNAHLAAGQKMDCQGVRTEHWPFSGYVREQKDNGDFDRDGDNGVDGESDRSE